MEPPSASACVSASLSVSLSEINKTFTKKKEEEEEKKKERKQEVNNSHRSSIRCMIMNAYMNRDICMHTNIWLVFT